MLEDITHACEVVKDMRASAREDAELVKVKTLQIMDKAVKFQRAHQQFRTIPPSHVSLNSNTVEIEEGGPAAQSSRIVTCEDYRMGLEAVDEFDVPRRIVAVAAG